MAFFLPPGGIDGVILKETETKIEVLISSTEKDTIATPPLHLILRPTKNKMIRIPGILKSQISLPLLILNLNRIRNVRYLFQLSFIPRDICKIKTLRKIQFIQIVVNIIMP